jgi:hypothetical protein
MGCNETRAEDVSDHEKANFCNWFEPGADAYQAKNEREPQSTRAQLDSLFGDGVANNIASAEQDPGQRLEELFREKSSGQSAPKSDPELDRKDD